MTARLRERSQVSVTNTGGYARVLTYNYWKHCEYGVTSQSGPYNYQSAVSSSCDEFSRSYIKDITGNYGGQNDCTHSRFVCFRTDFENQYEEVEYYTEWYDRFGGLCYHKVLKVFQCKADGFTGFQQSMVSGTTHLPLLQDDLYNMVTSIIADATSLMPSVNILTGIAELAEIKGLYSSIKDFTSSVLSAIAVAPTSSKIAKSARARRLLKETAGLSIANAWGLEPLESDVANILALVAVCEKRLRTLKHRMEKRSTISRQVSYSEYDEVSGTTRQTVVTLSCRALPITFINDETLLLNTLKASAFGLGKVIETCWSIVPMSFAVDAVTPIFKETARTIDEMLNSYSDLIDAAIQMPSRSSVYTTYWTMSRKTTAEGTTNLDLSVGTDDPVRFSSKWKSEQYDRGTYDLSQLRNASEFGASPQLGLLGSLGTLLIYMKA